MKNKYRLRRVASVFAVLLLVFGLTSCHRDDDEADEDDLPTLGFRSTGFELAESGIFGSYKEMRAEKGWQILFRMYDLYVRGKKMEKEMEKQKEKSKQNAND